MEQTVSCLKSNRFMLFIEIITVRYENHTKHTHRVGKYIVNVSARGTHRYHWTLMGSGHCRTFPRERKKRDVFQITKWMPLLHCKNTRWDPFRSRSVTLWRMLIKESFLNQRRACGCRSASSVRQCESHTAMIDEDHLYGFPFMALQGWP
jgi:hypothetical protein